MNRATKIGLNLIQKLKLDRVMLVLLNKKRINEFMLKHCWQHKKYKHFYKKYLAFREIVVKNKIDLSGKKILEVGSGASIGLGYFFINQGLKLWTASDFFQDLLADKRATKREKKLIKNIANKYDRDILSRLEFRGGSLGLGQKLNFSKLNIIELNKEFVAGFDIILSFDVLEHIEIEQIETAIKNLSAYLRPGGLMIHDIDFRDHLNPANPHGFFQYDPAAWDKLTKGTIFYTNRLRLKDYLNLFSRHGLKVKLIEIKEEPLNRQIKINKYFNKFVRQELEIIRALIISEKIN